MAEKKTTTRKTTKKNEKPIIKRIYQIADVHIPTYKRMSMFETELGRLVANIKEDAEKSGLSSEEMRIVICGDLVQSKISVTNELNVFASSFIRELSSIAKVICIAGNHDLIESDSARMDTVSGLFETAKFDNAVYLDMVLGYESGVVYDNNITWALYSFFNDFNCPDIETAREEKPGNTVVGLFHGMLVGSKLYNGYVADSGTEPNVFEKCDFVLAGHIHKRQEARQGDCKIVYAGSPFQLSFGESLTQHGYVIWDVQNKSYEFVDIPTEYGYYDISINSIEDLKEDKEVLNNY